MNKQELWRAICAKYPKFKNEDHVLKMTSRGLRRLVEQAWEEGHTKGLANGKALESMQRDKSKKDNPFDGLFDGFFGQS